MVYEATALSHGLEIAGAVRWFDLSATPRSVFGGLLVASPGLPPSLLTSVWAGPVTINLAAYETRPDLSSGDFDVVVETSVRVREGPFGLRGLEDAPTLVDEHGVWLAAGWLRMRVAATGREVAYDEAVHTAVEGYVVQVWPEEPSATVNLTTGERVQNPGPVEPVADPGVRVEVAEVVGRDDAIARAAPGFDVTAGGQGAADIRAVIRGPGASGAERRRRE